MNESKKDEFKSFAMPFNSVRDVKLEQPLLTPNYLKVFFSILNDLQSHF